MLERENSGERCRWRDGGGTDTPEVPHHCASPRNACSLPESNGTLSEREKHDLIYTFLESYSGYSVAE